MQAIRTLLRLSPGRSALTLGLALIVAACASEPQRQPRPTPSPAPRPAASTPAPAATPADWRDVPITPGNWSYRTEAGGSAAMFGPAQGGALALLRCDRGTQMVTLERAGAAPGPVPLSIVTTSRAQSYSATPASSATPVITVRLGARDSMLDALAFSRGRFAVEAAGLPTLYLPAWPEVARVVEDCR